MWIKSVDDLRQLVPEDGAWHTLDIMGRSVYVDGEAVGTPQMFPGVITEVAVVGSALDKLEIGTLQTKWSEC